MFKIKPNPPKVFSIQEKKDEEEIRKIFLNTVENIKKEKTNGQE